jgi:translation initiation factor 4E
MCLCCLHVAFLLWMRVVGLWGLFEHVHSLLNNLAPPSKLQIGSNYHLFKDGIDPKWEHPGNEKGGKWQVLVPRQSGKTDSSWLYSLLALIGETLDDEDDEICGAVISLRRAQDKLAIWTKTSDNTEGVLAMGQKIKALLELGPQDKLEYTVRARGQHQMRNEVGG